MNNLERYFSKEDLEKIRRCDDLYLKAAILVRVLFKDKVDKGGAPYIGHLKRVSDKMTTLEGKVAALLHDTVEDIEGVTFDDLRDIGIPEEIIEILILVTKEESEKSLTKEEKLIRYGKEIDRIIESGNQVAIELKISDMTDNYNPERLKLCSKEQREWLELKYESQLEKLLNARNPKQFKI